MLQGWDYTTLKQKAWELNHLGHCDLAQQVPASCLVSLSSKLPRHSLVLRAGSVAALTWRTVLGAGPGPVQALRLLRISEQLLCHLPVHLIRSWEGKMVGRERVMDVEYQMCSMHTWNHQAIRTFADTSKGNRLAWQGSQHRCQADPAHSALNLTPQSASRACSPCSLLQSELECSQLLFVLCIVVHWESDTSCYVGFKTNSGQFTLKHLF